METNFALRGCSSSSLEEEEEDCCRVLNDWWWNEVVLDVEDEGIDNCTEFAMNGVFVLAAVISFFCSRNRRITCDDRDRRGWTVRNMVVFLVEDFQGGERGGERIVIG
mmetsp:Transcript_37054/g.63018  ORF Transcript_37054/g.63018 Transcript_37054/m.63018 type:complete len:108 (-) Transcript_37054:35-358(-)